MSSRTLESKIEKWMNVQIRNMGGISYKFVSPGNPGVPDRIYLLPGGVIWFVELKAQSGSLEKIQRWQGERIRKIGCRYRLIRGMDEAREFIRDLKGGDA